MLCAIFSEFLTVSLFCFLLYVQFPIASFFAQRSLPYLLLLPPCHFVHFSWCLLQFARCCQWPILYIHFLFCCSVFYSYPVVSSYISLVSHVWGIWVYEADIISVFSVCILIYISRPLHFVTSFMFTVSSVLIIAIPPFPFYIFGLIILVGFWRWCYILRMRQFSYPLH